VARAAAGHLPELARLPGHAAATPGAPAPGTRSPYWNAAEQARWPEYDLAASVAYQGLDATVLDIRPLRPARLDARWTPSS
jgi:hypothetical protein